MLIRHTIGLCGLLLLSSCARPEADVPDKPGVKANAAGKAADGMTSSDVGQRATQPEQGTKPSRSIQPASQIAIGEKAPSFRLRDQHGQEHTFEELLKKGSVALVFYRSADW